MKEYKIISQGIAKQDKNHILFKFRDYDNPIKRKRLLLSLSNSDNDSFFYFEYMFEVTRHLAVSKRFLEAKEWGEAILKLCNSETVKPINKLRNEFRVTCLLPSIEYFLYEKDLKKNSISFHLPSMLISEEIRGEADSVNITERTGIKSRQQYHQLKMNVFRTFNLYEQLLNEQTFYFKENYAHQLIVYLSLFDQLSLSLFDRIDIRIKIRRLLSYINSKKIDLGCDSFALKEKLDKELKERLKYYNEGLEDLKLMIKKVELKLNDIQQIDDSLHIYNSMVPSKEKDLLALEMIKAKQNATEAWIERPEKKWIDFANKLYISLPYSNLENNKKAIVIYFHAFWQYHELHQIYPTTFNRKQGAERILGLLEEAYDYYVEFLRTKNYVIGREDLLFFSHILNITRTFANKFYDVADNSGRIYKLIYNNEFTKQLERIKMDN